MLIGTSGAPTSSLCSMANAGRASAAAPRPLRVTASTRASGGASSRKRPGERVDRAARRPRPRSTHLRCRCARTRTSPSSTARRIHERAESDALHRARDAESPCAPSDVHQQMRGSGSPTSMSTIRVPPNVVRSTTMPSGSAAISPIDGRRSPERVRAHRRQRRRRPRRAPRRRRPCPRWRRTAGRCRAGRRRRRTAGATGKVSARRARRRRWRRCASSLHTVPTPPRVGSRSQRVSGAAASSASTRPLTGAVSERMSASRARSPRASITAMPWSPMVPDTSTVARPHQLGPEHASRRDQADAGRRDEEPSAAPVPTTLVSPVTIAHPRGGSRLGHVGDDAAQLVDREALFDHERRGQPRRPAALHGDVVDRAVHGEVPDRAAREPSRGDDVRVGAERQAVAAGQPERRRVRERAVLGADEGIEEDGVDERGRGLPAGAVGERDHFVGEPRTAAAERGDAVEDRSLASARVGASRQPRAATADGEALLDRRPQRERQRALGLLDAVNAVGARRRGSGRRRRSVPSRHRRSRRGRS